jgi:DNA-binding FrmR family transcriptional regulator
MEEKDDILRRIKVSIGHLEGVERMIERDEYCVDVIKQIMAVQASLNRLSSRVLESHLHSCVSTAVRGDDPQAREKVLEEIAGLFAAATKV